MEDEKGEIGIGGRGKAFYLNKNKFKNTFLKGNHHINFCICSSILLGFMPMSYSLNKYHFAIYFDLKQTTRGPFNFIL